MSYREALPLGTVLDRRFRIDEIIGSGGFGITYLAADLGLQAPVAIKEYFPAQFAQRDSSLSVSVRSSADRPIFDRLRSSFLREAQTLARLDHTGIVRVHSVFESNGTAYMVMRFETGRSMKVWLEELGRAPTQAEIDRLLETLLAALHHMHSQSFLHRDIAPDNIIVRPDLTPVLVDFGSSRRLAGELTATVTGVVKEGYSPQEQYSVNAKAQGPWSDIYALGATLYRAVSGRKPEEATARMLSDTMLPLAEVAGPGYRPTFLAAVDKALSLHPSDRPQSVDAWRAALLGPPAEAQTEHVSLSPKTERVRRRGGLMIAAAVIAALLFVPAAVNFRPALIGSITDLWLTRAASPGTGDIVVDPPLEAPESSQELARQREAAARAEAERQSREAVVRQRAEEERRQALEAARAREAAEAAARAKAEREAREATAQQRAETERRQAAEAAQQASAKQAEDRLKLEQELAAARAQAQRDVPEAPGTPEALPSERVASARPPHPAPSQPAPGSHRETARATPPAGLPEASGQFDGWWTLTRTGANCFAGRVISFSFRIVGERTTNGRGRITRAGGFVFRGTSRKNGRPMHFSGALRGNTGRGTFYTEGGKCAGTFVMRRV